MGLFSFLAIKCFLVFSTLDQYLSNYKLDEGQAIAVTVSNLDDDQKYSFNEKEVFYPASLIKLFSAFYCQGKITDNEAQRAIVASLKDSDNDALSYLYDCFSKEDLLESRKFYTKYFSDQGFSQDLKLHNKCFSFAPYGKDQQLFQALGSNQVLISDIEMIMQKIIAERSELLDYMKRDGSDEQSEFIYQTLDVSKIDFFYSKAGWTSTVRHDTAYFSYQGKKYLMTILTKGLSEQKELIPYLASLAFIN